MLEKIHQQLNEAQNFLVKGQFERAQFIINEILALKPNDTSAIILKAKIEHSLMQFDAARHTIEQALAHKELSWEQLMDLAQIANQMELYFLLAHALSKLIEMRPGALKLELQLSLCLAKIGKTHGSTKLLQSLSKQDETNALISINLAHGYKALGLTEKAISEYKRFILLKPEYSGTGYWSLADLKNYKFSTQDIQAMHNTSSLNLNQKERSLVDFALTRALEQNEDYEFAFSKLTNANQKMSQLRPFNSTGFRNLVGSLLQFTPNNSSSRQSSNKTKPIFIVGLPRSGTTLTEQIIGSHSKVACTDELPFIERVAIQLGKGKSYTQELSQINHETAEQMRQFYLEQVSEYSGTHTGSFIDKNPTNFLHIGLIKTLFPHSKIVGLIRDPLDNGMSIYKQHFGKGNDFSYKLSDICMYYEAYLSLMSHWKALYSDDVYMLNYSQLVKSPDQQIKALLSFCNLEFELQCLSFYKSSRPVLTPSASQVRQPINSKGIDSSLPYKPYIKSHIEEFAKLRNKIQTFN
ncbi:sulfotransferase [Paraglaciecola sp.]|uniref:tetratricopeptide repeat-containing sulfotransferase family protein n=1 Tax=Paraglaciecola sp. TaxID=1920173 RepID=UPI0032679FC8